MKNTLIMMGIVAALTACGGNDTQPAKQTNDSTSEFEFEINQHALDAMNNPSDPLASIAGVWDFAEELELSGHDEKYVVIKEDGSYISYDYLGDESASYWDDYANCYDRSEGTLEKAESGNYTLTLEGGFDFENHLSLTEEGKLYAATDLFGGLENTGTLVTLLESDFTPLCNP